MRGARPAGVALAAATAALAVGACGPSSADRHISASRIPLVPGAQIVASAESCDPGRRAYCARDLVVIAPRFSDNLALKRAQRSLFRRRGWTIGPGEVRIEQSATSPDQRIRATYARSNRELASIAARQLKRPPEIVSALIEVTFRGVPALSIVLEAGPSAA